MNDPIVPKAAPREIAAFVLAAVGEMHANIFHQSMIATGRAMMAEIGETALFDRFLGDLDEGGPPVIALSDHLDSYYDRPRIDSGECDPRDLPYYRQRYPDHPMQPYATKEIAP